MLIWTEKKYRKKKGKGGKRARESFDRHLVTGNFFWEGKRKELHAGGMK